MCIIRLRWVFLAFGSHAYHLSSLDAMTKNVVLSCRIGLWRKSVVVCQKSTKRCQISITAVERSLRLRSNIHSLFYMDTAYGSGCKLSTNIDLRKIYISQFSWSHALAFCRSWQPWLCVHAFLWLSHFEQRAGLCTCCWACRSYLFNSDTLKRTRRIKVIAVWACSRACVVNINCMRSPATPQLLMCGDTCVCECLCV